MKIAIIGYGSLIWDLDDLAPKVRGDWQLGDGPELPVEFARISPKRKRALALVIDHSVTTPSRTSFVLSNRSVLREAVADLAARERTQIDHIGWMTRDRDFSTYSGLTETPVRTWLRASNYDAAVWTDLTGNFDTETGTPFSLSAATAYLKTLEGDALLEAWRYITYAPAVTRTPLRDHLDRDDWWHRLAARYQRANA